MGEIARQILDDWSTGCVNSMEPDQIPATAFIRGRNVAMTSIGGGKAVVMKRKGMRLINATQVTGATALVGQHEYKRLSGGGFTASHLLVSDSGRLDKVATDGTLTTISATAFTSSSTQEHLPSFADAQNLCFIVNGTERKKYDGTSLTSFGIAAPATAPTLADSGVAGSHNGTYEARVTYGNSGAGSESSAGPTSSTVTVTNKKINWTAIPVSSDAQVDTRYLYLRNTSTQANFYLAATIADNTTTTAQTNLTDATLITIGPDADENDEPPAGVKYLAWHRSRMFAADDTQLYYSKTEFPEAFDAANYEPVDPDNSQKITGIVSAFDLLVIFKSNAMYALVGDDPDTWSIRQIDASFGCVAHRSIIFANGALFFWSEQGPAVWAGSGKPELLGQPFIAETISFENLSASAATVANICGAEDIQNQRIMWAVPELGQSHNTLILPFNYRLQRWESDGWDPIEVASMAVVEDTNGTPWVVLGGYAGQTFRWWDATNDGVASGTTSGTFVASAGTVTVVSDLTAAFDITGGGLTARKVTICDASGDPVDTVRPAITSNTATSFTMVSSVGNLVNGATYTYYIGGPAFDFETGWLTGADALFKKRFQFLYIQLRPTNSVSNLRINTYVNYNMNPSGATSQTFAFDASTGQWDVDLWDSALWDSALTTTERYRVGRTGISFLARLRHYVPDTEFTLQRIGMQYENLSERIG